MQNVPRPRRWSSCLTIVLAIVAFTAVPDWASAANDSPTAESERATGVESPEHPSLSQADASRDAQGPQMKKELISGESVQPSTHGAASTMSREALGIAGILGVLDLVNEVPRFK